MPSSASNVYEVVHGDERFSFDTLRQMSGFARSLDRRGYDVRCQVRNGANVATFKREAWVDLRRTTDNG